MNVNEAQRQKLREWQQAKRPHCAACDGTEWQVAGIIVMPLQDAEHAFRVVALCCDGCRHVQLYSAGDLGL